MSKKEQNYELWEKLDKIGKGSENQIRQIIEKYYSQKHAKTLFQQFLKEKKIIEIDKDLFVIGKTYETQDKKNIESFDYLYKEFKKGIFVERNSSSDGFIIGISEEMLENFPEWKREMIVKLQLRIIQLFSSINRIVEDTGTNPDPYKEYFLNFIQELLNEMILRSSSYRFDKVGKTFSEQSKVIEDIFSFLTMEGYNSEEILIKIREIKKSFSYNEIKTNHSKRQLGIVCMTTDRQSDEGYIQEEFMKYMESDMPINVIIEDFMFSLGNIIPDIEKIEEIINQLHGNNNEFETKRDKFLEQIRKLVTCSLIIKLLYLADYHLKIIKLYIEKPNLIKSTGIYKISKNKIKKIFELPTNEEIKDEPLLEYGYEYHSPWAYPVYEKLTKSGICIYSKQHHNSKLEKTLEQIKENISKMVLTNEKTKSRRSPKGDISNLLKTLSFGEKTTWTKNYINLNEIELLDILKKMNPGLRMEQKDMEDYIEIGRKEKLKIKEEIRQYYSSHSK